MTQIKQAMILAAGRGERLRPITDHTPKPLVSVHGKPLIWHHLLALQAAGFTHTVINVCHLKQQIIDFIDSHPLADMSVATSDEGDVALETGGGMLKALPLLHHRPFLAVNGDLFTDFDFANIQDLSAGVLAHLVLVPNPNHNPNGDFSVSGQYLIDANASQTTYTYSGIGLFHPKLFQQGLELGHRFSVVPLIKAAIKQQAVTCEIHTGLWNDVGTPERLKQLNDDTISA